MKTKLTPEEINSLSTSIYFQSRDKVRQEIRNSAHMVADGRAGLGQLTKAVEVCISACAMVYFNHAGFAPEKADFAAVVQSVLATWTEFEKDGRNPLFEEVISTEGDAKAPWVDGITEALSPKPAKKTPKKSEWNRYLVDFGRVDELGRKTANVFSKREPVPGQRIQTGRTIHSRQAVAKVWKLPGNTAQLGDLVLDA